MKTKNNSQFGVISTEEAILRTMETPEGRENAFLCYYEWDISNAFHRFLLSEEWNAVQQLLSKYPLPSKDALDLGAGNGIGSYALFQSGYRVISLEPDPSELVGYGAIKKFNKNTAVKITCVSGIGEYLPFLDHTYGLVFCRQVLHHALNLKSMTAEIKRVLIPGGIFIATREHVIDDLASKEIFLNNHPLHKYTHAENTYSLDEYKKALQESGFVLKEILLSWDSVINHFPTTNDMFREDYRKVLKTKLGWIGLLFGNNSKLEDIYRRKKSAGDHRPGRMISFVAKAA